MLRFPRQSRRQLLFGGAASLATPLLARAGLAQGWDSPAGQAVAGFGSGPMGDGHAGSGPIYRIRTERPLLALTFDDGPHPDLTPRLLDLLESRSIRASFFVIGNRVGRSAPILRRMVAAGHEIGNHSWSHPRLRSLSDQALLAEFDQTGYAVADAVGRVPVLMRPPYGDISQAQYRLLRDVRGLGTVMWSVDPEDWRRPAPEAYRRSICDQVHDGAIVLSHDIISTTIDALPATLDILIERGFAFVTVSELLVSQQADYLRSKS